MKKSDFINKLRQKLSILPPEDLERSIEFYVEMINDKIEEGSGEEDSVAQIGSIDEIATQIISEAHLSSIIKNKVKPKKLFRTWEIILIVLGSPIWLSLLIAVLAVAVSIYIVIWAIIISLWAIELALLISAVGTIISSILFIIRGFFATGIAMIGISFVCAGITVLAFFLFKTVTKGIFILSKKLLLAIRSIFTRREDKE